MRFNDFYEMTVGAGGQGIFHHTLEHCDGPPCPFHSPSLHSMIEEPMNWRSDRQLLERICIHGIGHPDPDSLRWLNKNGIDDRGVHGCDGCCSRAAVGFTAGTEQESD